MKKIISLLIAVNLILAGVAYAEEYVDYSAQLSELETLLSECDRLGITADYERVNYSVIKRFESLLNDDIENGHPAVEQNIAYMDELYEETKANLTAYISGDKEAPEAVDRPDMLNTNVFGSTIKSNGKNVISVGYGHMDQARRDISIFPDIGMTNIQFEIGPNQIYEDFYGWNEYYSGEPDAQGERVLINNNYLMHITNNTSTESNVYLRYYRTISCTPGATYSFGCRARGNDLSGVWMSLNEFENRNTFETSEYWKNHSFNYTAGEDQTTLTFGICSDNVTDAYFDDFFVYELDENGSVTGENLVENPGMEEDFRYSVSTNFVTSALEKAENSNVAVCLLISPHYFPDNLDEDVYTDKAGFIKYNVHHPDAKAVIEEYLRVLMPIIKDYKALDSICISNEPTFNTMHFRDFYNPLFREYLEEIHGDIETLNEKYNTDYSGFDEIDMPEDLSGYNAICYDWIEFNDKMFTDWHKWMVDIIKEYLPEIPVHTKVMGYFATGTESADRNLLMRGTDLEYFDTFSDYAGNDTWDFMSNINLYYNTMFLYNYQLSVTDKPVYNSEDHIIEDRDDDFSPNQRKHFRNNLWMGAVHGRSMSTVWVWDKSTDTASSLYNGIAYRPDVAAEAGKTNLDFMRFNNEISRLQQEKPKTAILYSKPSRLYNSDYSQKLLWTYMSLLNIGEKVGIVSDNSIDLLPGYEVLIIPGVTNCKAETLEAVRKFADKGGKMIYTGDVLYADEYNNPLDNSFISEYGYLYGSSGKDEVNSSLFDALQKCGRAQLYFIDTATGEKPENLDWQYSIKNSNILLTVTNLEFDSTKNLELYMDGEQIKNMKNCFTGEKDLSTVTVDGYTPLLISINIPKPIILETDNITADRENSLLRWDYRTDKYFGANIYSVSDSGNITHIKTVRENQYTYTSPGTYLITALGKNMHESEGKLITVTDGMPVTTQCMEHEIHNDSITAEIQVENSSESMTVAVVYVKAYDSAGNVIGYSYVKLNLFPGKTDSFKTAVPTKRKADRIEIYATDSTLKGNILSENVIIKNE